MTQHVKGDSSVMRNDTQNIRAPRRDDKSRRRIVYLVCILILITCAILDIFFIYALLPTDV